MLPLVVTLHAALCAAAVAGCAMLLVAGGRERRGRLDEARVLGRLGGFVTAGATLACVVTGVVWIAWLDAPARARLFADASGAILATLGVSLGVLAGFVALLAGLSGKPRPGGYFATVILMVGLASTLAVALR